MFPHFMVAFISEGHQDTPTLRAVVTERAPEQLFPPPSTWAQCVGHTADPGFSLTQGRLSVPPLQLPMSGQTSTGFLSGEGKDASKGGVSLSQEGGEEPLSPLMDIKMQIK